MAGDERARVLNAQQPLGFPHGDLFREFFDFRPQFKIWLAANH